MIEALKQQQLGYLGIDVYEQEEKIFFRDLSENIIADDTLQLLMSFPNVLVTAHQAFFTKEALEQITEVTLNNIYQLLNHQNLPDAKACFPGLAEKFLFTPYKTFYFPFLINVLLFHIV